MARQARPGFGRAFVVERRIGLCGDGVSAQTRSAQYVGTYEGARL
jgi:hypothetical protein